MPKTANKVSFLIESQLPDFINEEYELFSKFIQKYYEQLEIQGQPLDIIENIRTYRDIDFYEKNVLKQSTTTTSFVQDTDTTIDVTDAASFPKNGGYIKIDDEICFYSERNDTQLLEVSRGVSGNTTLGDLYESSKFVTTQSADHVSGSTVQNISNLFLYALIKSFEKQYLSDFPEAYLKGEVDKRTLIKNISSFYQSKGTGNSIKFLFKCLIENDPNPEVAYPREFTLKGSESNWINVYALKAKILSGNPSDLVGKTITQTSGSYASAVVDNIQYVGKFDGEELYEIILSESSVNGEFSLAARTKLTKEINASTGVGDRIDVFSTMAWNKTGEFLIGSETITYKEKNVNQFVIETRTGTGTHPIDTPVVYGANVSGAGVSLMVYGVLYNVENVDEVPYSNPNETVEISEPGFLTNDIRLVDSQNNLRWITSTGNAAIADLNPNVSAIFEDGEGYYIASSGFPSHAIGTLPSDAQDQKLLKIIRKHPISTTETYETKYRDVGIALNGIPFVGYKDEDYVLNGPLTKISVGNRGSGYDNDPYVLINGVSGLARSHRAGQVVESVIIDTPGSYTSVPTVEILSGRNGVGTAVVTNGEVTSIVISNAGEYYSTAPEVKILDRAGKGRFAKFTVQVSTAGEITGFTKVTGGSLYTQENISVEIVPVGSGATALASIKEWRKDSYYKNQSSLDADNGYWLKNFVDSMGSGYSYYASPTTLRTNDTGATHSPILGFAYDGNPIYGAYGHIDPLDSSSAVTRMTSSYSRNITRANGPEVGTYPIGTFIDDYIFIDEYGSLDKNNGRFCVTPEFPNGTYAYFITVDSSGDPIFPYILGTNYYSLPLDSNYNSSISQDDIPVKARRLRSLDIDKNGSSTIAKIEDVQRGSVSSASIISSGSNFSVGNKIVVDDSHTDGYGAAGEVDSVKGRQVTSIASQINKVQYITLTSTAYIFDGDTITQSVTGATGKIVGDVFSGNRFALSEVTGTFNSTDVLSSNRKVISLILNQNSSYTKGATLSLTDGINAAVAAGTVLETTSSQNTVKIEVSNPGFIVSDTLFLSSSDLINTAGSRILSIGKLSEDLIIFNVEDNVALFTTSDAHGVGEDEKIDIDINPDDSSTTTTYYVRKRIYQEATLENPVISTSLSDTGVGRVAILNGGGDYTAGTYPDTALSGGTGSGAKGTIVVSSTGLVNSVTITDKGAGYKQFDILSVSGTALSKAGSSTKPDLQLSVDHVGFSIQNTVLNVNDANGITVDDLLKIDDEILKVISKVGNAITVERGEAVDHYNGAAVVIHDSGYNLSVGYHIKTADSTQPKVISYDNSTQKVVFAYDYDQTLTTINEITLTTTFFDESVDQRLVRVESVSDPDIYFEISLDQNGVYTRNPNIDIKKYYKYKFDTSHSSMSGVGFDVSPSINFNLVTPERVNGMGCIDLKLGYGSRVSSNDYSTRKSIPYTQYYYYDRDGVVNSEKSYLKLIDDPLQGEKTALYVTPNSIVYSTGIKASHDGSGVISYTSKSIFSVGEINSVKVTNIGVDYKKIPIVTGIYDNSGEVDTDVVCYLNSNDIGIPKGIKIINNGGAYHNDRTLTSNFTSNYILTISGGEFNIGETIVQRSGSTEIARARVTSWRKGSNILSVDRVKGIFRKNHQIIGLAKSSTAVLQDIRFTKFSPVIKTYFDNLGYYKSDSGKISDGNQKLLDSYYYQDYSYTVKSKTPINIWRSLIKETTHPAGFQLFGEVLIESSADVKMSNTPTSSGVSIVQLWDPEKNKISVESVTKKITQSLLVVSDLNVEKGVGSIAVDVKNNSEIRSDTVFLSAPFDGSLSNNGNLTGTKIFNLIDKNGDSVKPYNNQALVITLDAILQEPGTSYTIDEDRIIFAEPPLGPTVKDGQEVPGVTFHGRKFEFKRSDLNAKYLKKLSNIFQRNGRWLNSANQLDFNRKFIQAETLGYIKDKHPTLNWGSLESTCYRDIGLIVDALSHDLRFGGNQKTVLSAESYFNNGLLDHVSGELEPTLEAFDYVVRLCKLAMRNWDFIDSSVSWTTGSDLITVTDSDNIAIGMKISAGRAFPADTIVTEIVDERTIRVSNTSISVASGCTTTISSNVTTSTNTTPPCPVVQVAGGSQLQVGLSTVYSIASATGTIDSTNVPMTFIWSSSNVGMYYDASTLIHDNKAEIISSTIAAVDATYPSHAASGYTAKCQRDLGYLIDAVVYCLRFGGNQKVIDFADSFFLNYEFKSNAGELTESIHAYRHAKDLMIKAMRNQLTNTNPLIRSDTVTPICAEVESAIATYIQIVENTLEGGPDRIEVTPQNKNSTGNWTTFETYTDINIILDADLVPGKLEECEDVASALTTLNSVMKVILSSGPGSVDIGYADYIDGENTIFELYWEDGTAVSTEENEDLFIALSGVLQHSPAYSINRKVVPNQLVFDSPPIWGQGLNTKTVGEALAVDKFFGHGIGHYKRCKINNSGVESGAGPYLILDHEDDVQVVSDSRTVFVFIDGVLQIEKKSYIINGPTITFERNIYSGNNVEILMLYGRDIEPTITLFDYQRNEYYNEIILTCDAGSTNDFTAWKQWFGLNYDEKPVAYQKIGGKKVFIGNIKKYTTTDSKLIITLAGGNPAMDNSSIFFSGRVNYSDEYELTGVTNTISIITDDNKYRMQRNASDWLYGSILADEAFYERKKGLSNINVGDFIQIDGESDYRTIGNLPRYVNPKTYNPGDDVSNSFFGSATTTNYSGETRGVGLSVTCEITNGSVSSISWNKTDLQLLYDQGVLRVSDAYGYDSTPVLHFIPVDKNGGGARAEVKVSDGHIVDIVITDPGSGYTIAPEVVTARQYNIIKKRGRKVDTSLILRIEGDISQPSPVGAISWVERFKGVDAGIIGGFGPGNVNLAITTDPLPKQKVTLIIQRKLELDSIAIPQELVIWTPTISATVGAPVVNTRQITSYLELDKQVQCRLPVIYIDLYGVRQVQPGGPPIGGGLPPGSTPAGPETKRFYNFGFVDLRRISYNLPFHQGTLGPRFLQWEGAKFMTTGDILSTGGFPVSAFTIQEFEQYQLELQEWQNNARSGVADNGVLFNLGYPSINHYLVQLDTADLPDENGAGYVPTGAVVYTNTTNYPSSGTILIGRETISYTNKMSDRFIDCTRGANGSPIESHSIGDLIRTAL